MYSSKGRGSGLLGADHIVPILIRLLKLIRYLFGIQDLRLLLQRHDLPQDHVLVFFTEICVAILGRNITKNNLLIVDILDLLGVIIHFRGDMVVHNLEDASGKSGVLLTLLLLLGFVRLLSEIITRTLEHLIERVAFKSVMTERLNFIIDHGPDLIVFGPLLPLLLELLAFIVLMNLRETRENFLEFVGKGETECLYFDIFHFIKTLV